MQEDFYNVPKVVNLGGCTLDWNTTKTVLCIAVSTEQLKRSESISTGPGERVVKLFRFLFLISL